MDADSQADTFPWAFKNLFTLSALATFFKLYPQALNALRDLPAEVKSFGQQAAAGQPPEPALEEASNQWMQARAAEHQKLDRQYWRDIIAELRTLRATGRLVEEGAPVSV